MNSNTNAVKGYKWRIILFKTLAFLCYDDKADDYRSNIRNSLQMIQPKRPEDY